MNEKEVIVEEYRHKFQRSPVGIWTAAVGTFSNVMNQVWEFHPNHTGRYIDLGPFGYPENETLFEWLEFAELTIQLRVTKWNILEPNIKNEDEPENIEELNDWVIIHYDFKPIEHDCGTDVVMYEVGQKRTKYEGFWMSMTALSYLQPQEGPHYSDERQESRKGV